MYVITKQKSKPLVGLFDDTGDIPTFISGGLVAGAIISIFILGFAGGYMWKSRSQQNAYEAPATGMVGARRKKRVKKVR